MKIISYFFGVFTLFITLQSQAALISVQASADMSSGSQLNYIMVPLGTTVTADIQFDIGPGPYDQFFDFTNVSGAFTWDHSTYGPLSFVANEASIKTTNSAGWFLLNFTGYGSSVNSLTTESFSIMFDIGENPFTSTAELYDLVLNSTITKMRVGTDWGGGVDYGELETNVSGTISAVPVPAAVWLFGSGLIGLISIARRKKT